jgi:N-acetylmuramoyl-L-alanine amidase/FG-GAP-like repeat
MTVETHAGESSLPEQTPTSGFLASRGRKPRVWRVLTLASVLAVAPMVTGLPNLSTHAKPHAVKSQRHQVGFVKSSVAAMRVAKGATGSAQVTSARPDPITSARAGAVTGVQDVPGDLAVVGVTWPKNAVTAGDQFQIRTLTGATWSQWQTFAADQGDGPDPAEAATATRGTSPYVVTGASKFEVRSLTTDPTAPTAAKVQVVDPGTSSADSVQPPAGAAAAATAKPAIFTRAQWGADESLRRAAPAYGQVQLGFVHHTVSSNSYSPDQVPAMIRGIYAYHVQAEGWNDIGYNFLIDRFGRTWEGRYGGMDRAVVGAQTLNFNSVSTGVSAIGNFEVAAAPQAMTDAFKRLFAWKLSLSGIPATGTVLVNGKWLQRISGHRDGFQTACPGQYLYAKLPEIRTGAAALMGVQPRSTIARDVDRNGAADALSYSTSADGTSISGPVSLLASAPRQPVLNGVAIGTGWNVLRNASLSPDLTGDGKADIIAQDPAGNRLRIYLGNGRGGFAGVLYRGRGWNVMTRIIAARDRNGDGRNDILATNTNGDLIYYAGDGAGWVRPGRVIGRGWNTIGSITAAGDVNGDKVPDLLATRKSDGMQMMYAGRSDGSVVNGVPWGTGWGPFSTVVGGSDLDGDQYPDVYARLGGGMSTYSSDASGKMVRYTRWGAGWGGFGQLSTGADWNGDGVADLLAVNPAARAGTMILYAGTGRRDFLTRPGAFPTVPGADLVRLVGDVNGDGYTDAVARVRTNDTLVILLGQAGSTFAAPVVIATGWNAFNMIEAAGDYDNDGVPDLLARDANGGLFAYPLHRDLSISARMSFGAGWEVMQSVVGAGAFNTDANADLIALRASDHALVLYRGDGLVALQEGVVMVTAQNDLAQILGVGDYNGDGSADVLARSVDGSLWIYPGDGNGGLAGRQPVRGGEGAGHVLG